MTDVNTTDNSEEAKANLEEALESAGIQIGMLAEGYAKVLTPVDTGRLRNSITYKYEKSEHAVFIGTNTEYAPYVEEGHHRYGGKHMLKRAASEHGDEYRGIVEEAMKNA